MINGKSVRLLQVRAGTEPRNLAVGDPEVVEVGPAMFSIPQVCLTTISMQFLLRFVKHKLLINGKSQETLTTYSTYENSKPIYVTGNRVFRETTPT